MEFKTYLIGKTNTFIERCRWKAHFFLEKEKGKIKNETKESYGFKTANK